MTETEFTLKLENWKTQIRKGYLDLCLLLIIKSEGRIYGFELLERLRKLELPLKEGTLYPLLSRMSADGLLATEWETEGLSGHPRKFYSLTRLGEASLEGMIEEFGHLVSIYEKCRNKK